MGIHTSVELLHFTFQISSHTTDSLLLKFYLGEIETLTGMAIIKKQTKITCSLLNNTADSMNISFTKYKTSDVFFSQYIF